MILALDLGVKSKVYGQDMNSNGSKNPTCPTCGVPGRPVKEDTLNALLRPEVKTEVKHGNEWQFCNTPDCGTVYYSDNAKRQFTKEDLTIRVGMKETDAPRQVCYCFDHTIEEIEEQIQATGKTTVLDDIKTRMQEACWCQTKSPMGSCCLATVTKHIKEAEKKYRISNTAKPPASAIEDCCESRGGEAKTLPVLATATIKTSTTEKIAWAGGILSAIVASACCWLPLLLIATGVSGAAVSSAFETYRPPFIALTIVFLGAAFWFAYRPRKCSTSEGSCCPPTDAKVRTIQEFNRAILWVVTVIAIAFLFFPSYSGLLVSGGNSLAGRDDLDTITVKIEGMTCESCAIGLENSLTKLNGVEAAEVSYENNQAVIGIPKGAEVPRSSVLNAIKAAGFTGQFANLTQRIIPIEGMTCEACATHTQANLSKIPGITSVKVSYSDKHTVIFGDASVDPNEIIRVIEASGFRAQPREDSKPIQ